MVGILTTPYLLLFYCFIQTRTSLAEDLILVDNLNVAFQGNESAATILSHNFTVICHPKQGGCKEEDLQEYISIDDIDPSLCSHIVFRRFVIDLITFTYKLDDEYLDNEIELNAIQRMKETHDWLKILLFLDSYQFWDDSDRFFDPRMQRESVGSLLNTLVDQGMDGIYVSLEWKGQRLPKFTRFIQEVYRQIQQAGFEVVVSIKPGRIDVDISIPDFASSSYTFQYLRSKVTRHGSDFRGTARDVKKLVAAAGSSTKVLLALAPMAVLYSLKEHSSGPEITSDTCTIGRPTIRSNSSRLELGTAGISERYRDLGIHGVMLWRLCEMYNTRPSKWRIWRNTNHKEVFMCDGKHWITYSDKVYLQQLFSLIEGYYLSGVDLRYLNEGDFKKGSCDTSSNSSNKIRFPFLRNVNQLLSQITAGPRTPVQKLNIKRDLTLKASAEVCQLSLELESQKVANNERHIWFCLASMETNFNVSSVSGYGPPYDEQGCSTTRYGIFGLSNPVCSDTEPSKTCHTICDTNCADLPNNVRDSVRCLRQAMKGPPVHYHRYWSYCSLFSKTTVNLEECSRFRNPETITDYQNGSFKLWVIYSIFIGIVLAVTGSLGFWWHTRMKSKRHSTNDDVCQMHSGVDECCHTVDISKLHQVRNEMSDMGCLLDSRQFEIDYGSVLGYGCFGAVYPAKVMGKQAVVKVLNEETDERDIVAFLSETKFLIKIRLFLERCTNGSMETFLRRNRNEYGNALRIEHLIRWSYQIANGMNFLASKSIAHCDLAARNVLLDDAHVAKISDFGLSRQLHNYQHYIRKGRVPLPWRWMSIEALRDMKFSSASDVWSYGVTLYEIFSLGSVPYPGLTYTPAFIDQLTIFNMRPGRPSHADDFVYESVIQPCWNELEIDRPEFAEILKILRPVLEECSSKLGYRYMDEPNDSV